MGCERLTDPFKVPMNDPELVKVSCAGHDPGELTVMKDHKNGYRREISELAHQSQTVYFGVGLGVLHHVPISHPVRDDTEAPGIRGEGNPQQWQDVRVRQALPTYDLPAKPLRKN